MRKINNSNNLPKGWQRVRLGEILRPLGFKIKKIKVSEYKSIGKISIFDQGSYEIAGYTDDLDAEYRGELPAILFGDHTLLVKLVKFPFAIGADGIQILNPNTKILDRIFFYYIIKYLVVLKKLKSYGYERHLKYLRELDFIFPQDISEQKRIAEILSAFDEKIELNNKINKTLEEMAQAIFKEWLSKNQKSNTKKQKLGDLIDIISGYPFSSKLYVNNKKALGVVTIKNVQDGNFITSCDSFIQKKDIPKNMNKECLIHDGDILLSLTGNVGRICFVYGGKYLLNQRVAKLKPKNEKDRAFSYFLFRQKSMQNRLINMAKGSAQPNLSPVETGEIKLEIPSRDILDRLGELLNPIYQKLIQNKNENQTLAALRDLLLPKLMSGEIRV